MRIMRRIVLALFFVLAVCSVASCDDDYEYIYKNTMGSDFYLNKYHFIRSGSSNVVSYVVKVVISPKHRKHIVDKWSKSFNDENLTMRLNTASWYLFFQEMNLDKKQYRYTGYCIYDKNGKLIKASQVTTTKEHGQEYWESISDGTKESVVLEWINKNRPTIYDSEHDASVADFTRHERARERERMKSNLQTRVSETEEDITDMRPIIIILCLIGAVILSISLGLALEYLANRVIGPDNLIPPEQPDEKVSQESEVIDAEFTDANESDEYEYPCEDIGKVVGEKQ